MKKLLFIFSLCVYFTSTAQTVSLQQFASGLSNPVDIANCGDDRLFVVQQGGAIRIIEADGTLRPTPFLDITNLVFNSGERGLLGLAFHPEYQTNGYFFVNYIEQGTGSTIIARYQVSETDENVANTTGETVITITQPYNNHNGGSIKFGPDGLFYIAMGDGGSGGDPDNYGQNLLSMLGKLLRINVDQLPYTIPADNPYATSQAGLPEIYAYGLRNPWKFSFDHQEGDIWIADVGQNAWEEVNKVAYTSANQNYGWRCFEGNNAYNTNGCDLTANYLAPIHVYANGGGDCSVTGGYVYRGTTNPAWQGKYFFADFCSNKIFVLDPETSQVQTNTGFSGAFSTFGEDINGNLYVAGRSNGTIYRLTSPTAGIEQEQAKLFTLYPNPGNGIITIQTTAKEYKITIFNIHGSLLATHHNQSSIDLSHLTNGNYIIQIENNETSTTYKWQKN